MGFTNYEKSLTVSKVYKNKKIKKHIEVLNAVDSLTARIEKRLTPIEISQLLELILNLTQAR